MTYPDVREFRLEDLIFRGADRSTMKPLSGEIVRCTKFLGNGSSAQVIFEGPREVRSVVITNLVENIWAVASCMTMPNLNQRDPHDSHEVRTDIMTTLLSRATQPMFHMTPKPPASTTGEFAQIWALPVRAEEA